MKSLLESLKPPEAYTLKEINAMIRPGPLKIKATNG